MFSQLKLRAAVETLRGRQSWRRPHPAIDAQTGPVVGAEDSMEVALAKVQQGQDTKVQDFFDNILTVGPRAKAEQPRQLDDATAKWKPVR